MGLRLAKPDPPPTLKPAQVERLALLAREINADHAAGVQALGQAAEYFRSAGLWLIEAKAHCGGHGYWLDWLDANIAIDVRQVQKYMRLAKCAPAGAHLAEEWQIICGRGESDDAEDNADGAEDELEEGLEDELDEEMDAIGQEEDAIDREESAAAEEAAGYAAPICWEKQVARMAKHTEKTVNPARAFDHANAPQEVSDLIVRVLERLELNRQDLELALAKVSRRKAK